jgi:heptosyltransferase-3
MKIRSSMKNDSRSLGGRLSLGELIALLQVSRLFIGNDSGPMHLACLSGVPVVALFGPADEGRWGPLSEDSVVVRGALPCEKCARSDCGLDFQCIRTLSQGAVKEAVRKLMNITHTDVR